MSTSVAACVPPPPPQPAATIAHVASTRMTRLMGIRAFHATGPPRCAGWARVLGTCWGVELHVRAVGVAARGGGGGGRPVRRGGRRRTRVGLRRGRGARRAVALSPCNRGATTDQRARQRESGQCLLHSQFHSVHLPS